MHLEVEMWRTAADLWDTRSESNPRPIAPRSMGPRGYRSQMWRNLGQRISKKFSSQENRKTLASLAVQRMLRAPWT